MKGRYIIAGIGLSALVSFGAVKYGNQIKEKKMAPLKSYISTTEYKVQKGDYFENLAYEWIPVEIRSQYKDPRDPWTYLMELNHRTSDFLQIGETLKKPIYSN